MLSAADLAAAPEGRGHAAGRIFNFPSCMPVAVYKGERWSFYLTLASASNHQTTVNMKV